MDQYMENQMEAAFRIHDANEVTCQNGIPADVTNALAVQTQFGEPANVSLDASGMLPIMHNPANGNEPER